ncbi:hypothetical protein OC834_001496 [Tilletia horrida]|uniref:Altered inheritance of mitochondria protein 41 n=1 Tax=Tilletia horrida TaxID=155126 RepID=A0AAN6GB19_9BASI|nr:hypothetical protein OC842_006053 [Tilletia horrida]KAK0526162.1 hypothetical protein OC835_005374 [Tilletia horrida]KAK0535542.1 hypothetical protein OC834_001496 [Tilletia horrida]KAK0556337.1 hypothetical protein OC844_005882 [Tilletia horrida]
MASASRLLVRAALLPARSTAAASPALSSGLSQRSFSVSPRALNADADADLLASIKTQLKESMRAKDSSRSTVLRSLLSDFEYAKKQPNAGGEASLSAVLQKAVARRTDAAAQFRAATPSPREDLAEKEDAEAKIIQAFLPEPMSADELGRVVREVLDEVRAAAAPGAELRKLAGQVIKGVNAKVDKARVTGAEISKAVTELLKQSS